MLEDFLEHGENFMIFRGQETLQQKGLRNTDRKGREYIGFLPGTDIRVGDLLKGETTGNEHRICKVEAQLFEGEVFEVKAFIDADDEKSARGRNTINIESMVHSAIQQGSSGAVQTVSSSSVAKADVSEIINSLLAVVDRLAPSDNQHNDLEAEIDTIKAQLRLAAPKQSVVVECFKSVKGTLETIAAKAAGTALGTLATHSVDQIAAYLSHHGG